MLAISSITLLLFTHEGLSQNRFHLSGQLSLPISFTGQTWQLIADVWGYVDPTTGEEYALVGRDGPDKNLGDVLFIINVSDPVHPRLASTVEVPGADVKVWQHYAYAVTGFSDRGSEPEGRIVDISDPAHPLIVGSFPSSHNIFIDGAGYMYLEAPGLRILDLNADPTRPSLVWENLEFEGHDATVIGDRLFDFQGNDQTYIYDVSERSNPQLLSVIADPSIAFHHSGWTTTDGRYLFICDEASRNVVPDVTIWDVSDVENPQRVGEIDDPEATVHNLYVIDDRAYVSFYTAGFRVYDVSDPTQPQLIYEFNTATRFGAFGVYPFSPSGHIYVSDRDNGFFVFSTTGQATASESFPLAEATFTLASNFPNPFTQTTRLVYELTTVAHVPLTIFNLLGQPVRTLVDAFQGPGGHQVVWDGKSDAGQLVSTGTYIYRLEAGNQRKSKILSFLGNR